MLRIRTYGLVLTSPMQRALETCRLAGYGEAAELCADAVEWDYGDYEGRTTAEIREEVPGWTLWDDGVPSGDTAASVAARADRVIARTGAARGTVLVFSHAHFLRVLAARWLALDAGAGRYLALSAGSVSVLSHEREQPVVESWNLLG